MLAIVSEILHTGLDLVTMLLFGSMVFFLGIIVPAVHKLLDGEQARALLRELFPRYYLWSIALCGAALALSVVVLAAAKALLIVALLVGYVYCRQYLNDKINQASDKWLTSDEPSDKANFIRLHKQSVMINVVQVGLLLTMTVFDSLH